MAGWSNTDCNDNDWQNNASTITSVPISTNEESHFIYWKTYGSSQGDVYAIESPAFDFNTASNPSLNFDYYMFFEGNSDGTLKFDVSIDGGSTWTTEWSKTGDKGPNWHNAYVPLSSYNNSSNVILRYHFTAGTSGSGYDYTAAIDYMQIRGVWGTESQNLPGFVLYQNIPNPAEGKTTIDFEVPFGGKAKFEVTDQFGRSIYNEEMSVVAGRHTVRLNVNDWSPGVYYYHVTFDSYRLVKKMVIR